MVMSPNDPRGMQAKLRTAVGDFLQGRVKNALQLGVLAAALQASNRQGLKIARFTKEPCFDRDGLSTLISGLPPAGNVF